VVHTEQLLGYIIWQNSYAEADLTTIASVLRRYREPKLFIDTQGEHSPPNLTNMKRILFSFPQQCGEIVGRYLLQTGARHGIFVQLYPGARWSDNRIRGLNSVCSLSQTMRLSVVSFNLSEHAEYMHDIAQQVQDRVEKTIVANGAPLMSADDLYTAVVGLSERLNAGVAHQHIGRMINEKLVGVLRQHPADVIVGENDTCALMCREALRSTEFAGVGIIGFDDTPDAISSRLTSYNFNVAQLAKSCCNLLLSSSAFDVADDLEIPGFVVERA
jgi:hypothetical protein